MINKNTRKKLVLAAFFIFCFSASLFSREKKSSVELDLSINWTFGCYKETTFSNISQSILAPRFQLASKIYSGDFLHIITADYFFAKPESAMTKSSLVYKNYDPVTGENYYEGFNSNLAFHRISLQYDLSYKVMEKERMLFYFGGNFACNAFLQFEHYPSITGIISIGPSAVFNYKLNERNSFFAATSLPLLGYGVRPPYAGCDAELMKYAEENFMKVFSLGNFLSIHNHQSILLQLGYKIEASKNFTLGIGFDFEYGRIEVPKERPLYYVDGNFKTTATIKF